VAKDLELVRPELLTGPLIGDGDVTRPVHSDGPSGPPEPLQGLAEEKGAKRAGGPPMIASINENP
jgi:hypothetical protein